VVQHRQCTVCVTYHRCAFLQQLLHWKGNKNYIFWVCVCSIRYPTCNAHAPQYIVICCLSGSNIFFPHIIACFTNGTTFGEKSYWTQNDMILCTSFVLNICHSKTSALRYKKNAHISCQIWMKIEFSWRIYKKYSNTKFHENSSSGSRFVPCKRTNGGTDRKTLRSQLLYIIIIIIIICLLIRPELERSVFTPS
jgi:hypothetical protein